MDRPPGMFGGRAAGGSVAAAGGACAEERSGILLGFCASGVVFKVCY
jgi:hypothetical protein